MNRPEPPEETEMESSERSQSAEAKRGYVDTISARTLLGSSGMLRIELDGELYTLRVTRNNRLILTK